MKRAKQRDRVVKHTKKDGTVVEYRYRAKRTPAPRQTTGTVGAAVDAYLRSPKFAGLALSSQKIYRRALARIGAMSDRPLTEVRRRHLLGIMDALADRPGSANDFASGMGAWLTWCVKRDLIESSPATRLEPPEMGHHEAWSEEDIATVLSTAPEDIVRACLLALHTAQRAGDIVAMRWDQVEGDVIRLVQGKTKTAVLVPVTAELASALATWKAEACTLTILATRLGRPWTADRFNKRWSYWRNNAGLRHLRWHGLRASATNRMLLAGATTFEAASITGHKSMAQLEKYARDIDRERLARTAIEKLNAKTTKP